MKTNAVENGVIQASKAVTLASGVGGGAMMVFGLSISELSALVGIAVAVIGLLLGQYWSWRRDRREQAEADDRMRRRDRREHAVNSGRRVSLTETDWGDL